jgi:predicted alpha/beta superfamily hydrolase
MTSRTCCYRALLLVATSGLRGASAAAQARTAEPPGIAVRSAAVAGDLRLIEMPSRVFQNTRNLRVLLPEGYTSPENRTRRYPVLYLADGQNLFDPATSVFGPSEWQVDETMKRLVAEGRIPPMIVVGVDDAGRTARAHEYLPYPDTGNAKVDPAYDPKPAGRLYPEFLIDEVIPFVNARYRTLTGPENTALGGSSYGGLISAYVFAKRPDVFGAALLESPTMMVYGGKVITDVAAAKKLPRRIFMAVGTNEDGHPDCDASKPAEPRDAMVYGVRRLESVLRAAGLDSSRLRVVVVPCARHTHAAWAARLPDALTFLFGDRR